MGNPPPRSFPILDLIYKRELWYENLILCGLITLHFHALEPSYPLGLPMPSQRSNSIHRGRGNSTRLTSTEAAV